MIQVRTGDWRLADGALVVGVWIALRRGRRSWSREIVFRHDRASSVAYHLLRQRAVLTAVGIGIAIAEIALDATGMIANRATARAEKVDGDGSATG